jgi:tRNA (guanine37-N1)-methyltransferase
VRIDVLTIFPEYFTGPLTTSLVATAREAGHLDLRLHDLRAWSTDRHRSVDDAPYGGGAGMVMRADVLIDAAEAVWNDLPEGARLDPATVAAGPGPAVGAAGTGEDAIVAGGPRPRTVVFTPRGRPLDQALVRELAEESRLVLLCGRYEGIDERVHEVVATDEVSLGDYVLMGGEVAAAALTEAVVRLLPGVLGNAASAGEESFEDGLLEHPHYTRPAEVRGRPVPAVLRSGDHGAIAAWRHAQALARTRLVRPDLLGPREDPPSPSDDPGLR